MNQKIIVVSISLIVLAGIIGFLYPISVTEDKETLVNTDQILGSKWMLQTLTINGQDILLSDKTNITIQFDEKNIVKGSGGCNSFSGEYQAVGEYQITTTTIEGVEEHGVGGKLSFNSIAQTEMACIEDNIMDQENQFFETLNQVVSFEVISKILKIVSEDEQTVLSFESK